MILYKSELGVHTENWGNNAPKNPQLSKPDQPSTILNFVEIQGENRSKKILQKQFPGERVTLWTANNLHSQLYFVVTLQKIIEGRIL